MSEMVERVAHEIGRFAIYPQGHLYYVYDVYQWADECVHKPHPTPAWEDLLEHDEAQIRASYANARAVIEEMRGPSQNMRAEAIGMRDDVSVTGILNIWRDMIDAALK